MNNVNFIKQCIESVIDQNCPNLEHLVIDGASNDGTLEIVKDYADQYKHITWISEKDGGQSEAMNKGVKLAKGEIITFLNVDDYFEEGILNSIEDKFRGLPVPSIIVGNCNVLNGDKEDTLINVNKPSCYSFENIFRYWRYDVFPGNPAAYFYHKALHEKAGDYNVDDYYVLDYDFLYRAARFAHIKYFDETWGNFRYYKGTKTEENVSNGNNVKGRRDVAYRYLKYLSDDQKKRYLEEEKEWKKESGFKG